MGYANKLLITLLSMLSIHMLICLPNPPTVDDISKIIADDEGKITILRKLTQLFKDNVNLIPKIINKNPDNFGYQPPLLTALKFDRDPKLINLLLEYGADPNLIYNLDDLDLNESPLLLALFPTNNFNFAETMKITESLLKYNADINKRIPNTQSLLSSALDNYSIYAKDKNSQSQAKYYLDVLNFLVEKKATLPEEEKAEFSKLLKLSQDLKNQFSFLARPSRPVKLANLDQELRNLSNDLTILAKQL